MEQRRLTALILALAGLASCSSSDDKVDGAEVVFSGRKVLSEGDLREAIRTELDRYDATHEPAFLSDAAFRIVHQYELEGYAGTRVEFTVEPKRIVFVISEAPYLALGTVRIRGTHAIKEEELLKGLPGNFLGSVPFSERLIQQLQSHIVAAYASRGYVEAAVAAPEVVRREKKKKKTADVTLTVTEGKRYLVKEFDGLADISAVGPKLQPMVGKPFTPNTPDEAEAVLLDYYREHGHPFARATVRPEPDRETGTVVLKVTLVPGPAVRVGGVRISGNERTRTSFIEARADLEDGKEFRASDIREAERRLIATGLFHAVEAGPGQEEGGRVPIEIRVRERDPGEVSGRLGYGTLDGPRAGAEVRYSNLLGGAELVRAGGTISRFGYRAEAELAFPFILGSDFRPGTSGYYEDTRYPSFEAVSTGAVVSLSYPLLPKVQTTVGVRYAIIRTTEVEPGVPPGDLLDFSYTAPFLSVLWDERDSPLLPSRGFVVDGRLEGSDRAFSPDIQFVNASGRATYLLPLPEDLVLAASFQGGLIVPLDRTDVIPVSLRYFAGGTNTVRGFKFASLGPKANGKATGGETMMSLQVELRYPIWGDLHGAVFSDRGGVWEDHQEVNLSETRYSVGTGLRYHTPAGAIVADFAWNPARRDGESGWAFHFSIGFPF